VTTSRRKGLLFLLLAVAVVGLLARQLVGSAGSSVFGVGNGGPDFARALDTEVMDLDLERLERGGAELSPGRDPWRFSQPPPPPVAPPPVVQPVRVDPPPRPVAAVPPRPRPPAIEFQFLGRFGPKRRPIAVFLDQDGETLYNALEGDVLKGRFQVAQIGLESVQIAFVGFPDEPPTKLAVHGAER
jgi:hypothetical protein